MPEPTMSAPEFAEKWRSSSLKETAGSQSHFNDLCAVLGVETPATADREGTWYTFERGAKKSGGGDGFADVWKRGHFAWEYKGKHKDLEAAYQQLLRYREALENPPLLVVSDMDRFEVHTNFENSVKQVHKFDLVMLRDASEKPLATLRAVMGDPETLRPKRSREQITKEAAAQFAILAERLQERGHDRREVAGFLNKLLFCFYAEDANLLPGKLFTRVIEITRNEPADLQDALAELFAKMNEAKNSRFGADRIDWFNGGLFDDDTSLPLEREDIAILADTARLDWADVEPSILGTLFERGLDPDKRKRWGIHYTDKESILRVVEPVIMQPLRREYTHMQEQVETKLAGVRRMTPAGKVPTKRVRDARAIFQRFRERLRTLRILDPACGSGNFLYVALQCVKDLEKEAGAWAAERLGIAFPLPQVDPSIVYGVEKDPYAHQLASVSVWIGEIQWMRSNGFHYHKDPILRPLGNIECRDAILARDASGAPVPAAWPEAEFIVGNPPFLGLRYMRESLGDDYVEPLWEAWEGTLPKGADLVCYWHEIARRHIEAGTAKRAGLLATNSIRDGANRATLERVKQSGDIFMAWSDEPWVVEGAAVRVSIVAQDDGSETERRLDGEPVSRINSDLTSGVDLTAAGRLLENGGVSFRGSGKVGPFDIPGDAARRMLREPSNVNGRPNSDVVVPWANGLDVARRPRGMFSIDFGTDMTEAEAADYEAPFAHVEEHVRPMRAGNSMKHRRERWWLHGSAAAEMRVALQPLSRFIVTPMVGRHRLFVWLSAPSLPDQQLIVIAREDDYTFGVLHSRAHEWWSVRMGSRMGVGNDPRYTSTTTFDTFPFPWPLDTPESALTSEQRSHRDAIAAAARDLNAARERWLNPPELVREEPDVVPSLPPRLLPVSDEAAAVLKKRTLTNLYNDRPSWLAQRHAALDAAVWVSYGWGEDVGEEEALERLLALNVGRGGG